MDVRRTIVLVGAMAVIMGGAVIALLLTGGNERADAANLDGEWRSRGYGWIWSIKGGKITSYDVTENFCIRHKKNDTPRNAVKRIRPDSNGESFRIALDGPSYSIAFDRIAALPASCAADVDTGPDAIFRVVSETFAANYAFFGVRNIDWASLVSRYEGRIDAGMDDEDLFLTLSDMLAPIDDSHVGLEGEVDDEDRSFEPPSQERAAPALAREHAETVGYWTRGIGPKLVTSRLYRAGGNDVRYGLIGEDIGYIRIRSIGSDLREAAEDGMSHARGLFKDAAALIVDLTGNGGGYDGVARRFATLLAAAPVVGYYKYPGDAEGAEPQPVSVEPAEARLFSGPIILVTDRETISAAEILVMCLRALPNVIHIGEATQGSLSDILQKTLPNGWTLNLSNEVYLDSEKEAWEGVGIPPHIEFIVHKADAVQGDHEAAARAVIDFVTRQQSKS